MEHKSLTAYGICDDCKDACEPICFPPSELAMHEERLLCQECFDQGGYAEYDEDKDEFLPHWNDLPTPGVDDIRVTLGDKTYRLTEVSN